MATQYEMKLRYTSPPKVPKADKEDEIYVWENYSLPLGNGCFGACAFGYTDTERIQITENSLANPYARPKERDNFYSKYRYGLCNFAELYIDFNHTQAEQYQRELSIDDATAKISYTHNGVRYTREYFTSHPGRILAMRLTSDKENALSFTVRCEIPGVGNDCMEEDDGFGKTGAVLTDGNTLILRGETNYYRIKFEGQLKVITNSGRIKTAESSIRVEDATDAVLIFCCATNYKLESRVFLEEDAGAKLAIYPHPHETICKILMSAEEKGYDALRREHLEDYHSLYNRVKLKIGNDASDIPTDELLYRYKSGDENRYLECLLFQWGRYLLISSSRRGCLPANLQGIWNVYNSSPWSCGYWHNINVQMNYWPACISNLQETFLAYSDYSDAYMAAAKKNADVSVGNIRPENRTADGTNGWIIGTGAWPYEVEGFEKIGHSGPGTGGFTSLLFWDYFDYTRDLKYLRDVCYPRLRDMSIYLSKMLKEKDGVLLISPSASPEIEVGGKYYITEGCAFDQQMVYENYKRTLQAAEILGISEPIIETIKEQIDRLEPVLIGEDGQIKEFREERHYGEIGERGHRHISHLVGMYPGTLINANTKEWLDAAKITLTERGDKSHGWAAAHRLCLWTRAKCPQKSMALVRSLINNNLLLNLWDNHPPFQIDGNFGYTAGVCEMLVQSQSDYIELLPSLPCEWNTGSFVGIVTRANFTVDCTWEQMKPTRAKFTSRAGEVLKIKCTSLSTAVFTLNGTSHTPSFIDGNIFVLETKAGDVIEISWI